MGVDFSCSTRTDSSGRLVTAQSAHSRTDIPCDEKASRSCLGILYSTTGIKFCACAMPASSIVRPNPVLNKKCFMLTPFGSVLRCRAKNIKPRLLTGTYSIVAIPGLGIGGEVIGHQRTGTGAGVHFQ